MNTKKNIKKGVVFLVLMGCAMVFALPFCWLVLTSFKSSEEVYSQPQRVFPIIPFHTTQSPFFSPAEQLLPYRYSQPLRPALMSPEVWHQIQEPILDFIWNTAAPILEDASPTLSKVPVAHFQNLRPALTHYLWNAHSSMLPQAALQHLPALQTELRPHLTADAIRDAYRKVFRSFALGAPTFIGIDGSKLNTRPVAASTRDGVWLANPQHNALVATWSESYDAVPMFEVAYDLNQDNSISFWAALRMSPSDQPIRTFDLPFRSDHSYHAVALKIRSVSGTFVPSQPFYLIPVLESNSIAAWTFSFMPKSDRYQDIIELQRVGDSDILDPLYLEIELTVHRLPRWRQVAIKFSDAYRKAFNYVPFARYTFNSTWLVAVTILGSLCSSSLIAYAFARLRWFGRNTLFFVVLATMMLPPQVTMVPHFVIIRWLGWYDTFYPLWVPSLFGNAFFIFLLRQFMLTIPTELESAGKIDGCNYFDLYRLIIIPLVKPALICVAIFTFMATWNDFMTPLVFITSEERVTLALGLYLFTLIRGGFMAELMAVSLVMIAPVMVVFFSFQKYFIQGITLTGIKG